MLLSFKLQGSLFVFSAAYCWAPFGHRSSRELRPGNFLRARHKSCICQSVQLGLSVIILGFQIRRPRRGSLSYTFLYFPKHGPTRPVGPQWKISGEFWPIHRAILSFLWKSFPMWSIACIFWTDTGPDSKAKEHIFSRP